MNNSDRKGKPMGSLLKLMNEHSLEQKTSVTVRIPVSLHKAVKAALKRDGKKISDLGEISWRLYLEEHRKGDSK